jgi:catechol 2,3-dioxygenase-like lactoylglutathione lyase family enzyme
MKPTMPAFAISRIGQISVNVHDLKRATEFYRDTLGMKFLFEAPNLAFFDCNGLRIMLGVAEKPEFDHPASVIYYRVEDIQEAFEVLTSRGVQFEMKPHLVVRMPDHDLWMGFFRDSENNTLSLMSEVPRQKE